MQKYWPSLKCRSRTQVYHFSHSLTGKRGPTPQLADQLVAVMISMYKICQLKKSLSTTSQNNINPKKIPRNKSLRVSQHSYIKVTSSKHNHSSSPFRSLVNSNPSIINSCLLQVFTQHRATRTNHNLWAYHFSNTFSSLNTYRSNQWYRNKVSIFPCRKEFSSVSIRFLNSSSPPRYLSNYNHNTTLRSLTYLYPKSSARRLKLKNSTPRSTP